MWTFTAFILIKLFALTNSQDLDYTLNFNSPIYVCSDEGSQGFVDTSEVVVDRYNESTAVLHGVVKFLKGFETDTMIEFIIEKDVGGSYETVLTYEICDFCKELADPESDYGNYLKYFGFPGECPFEPNSYHINDLVADKNGAPINGAMVGDYQVTMNLLKTIDKKCFSDTTFIACLKLDLVIDSL